MSRHAGVILPLCSAPSSASWGLGELRDLEPLSAWLSSAGFDRLMLLPLGTMPAGETSPYSAASAMAIDPIYISLSGLEDYERAGGDRALSADATRARDDARASPRIAYAAVRKAKSEALELAFESFLRDEWQVMTARAAGLAAFIARERWWLADYALYQAMRAALRIDAWRAWPAPLRDRDPRALDDARRTNARAVLRQQYFQWIAATQWQAARKVARSRGVRVVGDVPFVVSADSADVWVRAAEFMLDVSAGVPPDAFSETGQDWGLPTYRWDAIASTGYAWMEQRARRTAALYDGARVDHLVGFYRTFGRPPGGQGFFIPSDEPTQTRQGETILRIFLETGVELLAEDLGTVPDFVRASMARMGVPGCKVLRWERDYHAPGHPFIDPATFARVSVTLSGTHDTETLAAWWDGAGEDERRAFSEIASLRRLDHDRHSIDPAAPWSEAIRDRLLDLAYRSASDHVFLPMQDVFGWRDRINRPATVNDVNWTWRLPWHVDALRGVPAAVERAAYCRASAIGADRGAPRAPEGSAA